MDYYTRHQSSIRESAMKTSGNYIAPGVLALLSIKRQWDRIPGNAEAVAVDGLASPKGILFGPKFAGLSYMVSHQHELFEYGIMYDYGQISQTDLLVEWLKVPGLGLAKAGFTVQMLHGFAGYMDTHNLKKYDVGPKDFYLDSRSSENMTRKKTQKYLELCDSIGTKELWLQWCDSMSKRYPGKFYDGRAVSAVHLQALAPLWDSL